MKGALVGAAVVAVAVGLTHATPREAAPDSGGGVSGSSSGDYPMMCGRGELFAPVGHQRGECGPVVVDGHHTPAELQRICDDLAEVLRAQGEDPTDCDVTTTDGQRVTLPLTPSTRRDRRSN